MANNLGEWEILTHEGVGKLRFGQTRYEVHAILGEPSKAYRKTPSDTSNTEFYEAVGLHLRYAPNETLEGIDAGPLSRVVFQGMSLINMPMDNAVRELERRGYTHRDYVFDDAGLALYVLDGLVKGVSLFPHGAHDMSDPESEAGRASRAAKEWLREYMGLE